MTTGATRSGGPSAPSPEALFFGPADHPAAGDLPPVRYPQGHPCLLDGRRSWTATGWTGGRHHPQPRRQLVPRSIWAEPAVINRRIEARSGRSECGALRGRRPMDAAPATRRAASWRPAPGVGRRAFDLRDCAVLSEDLRVVGPATRARSPPSSSTRPGRAPDPGLTDDENVARPLTRQRAISTDSILTPTDDQTSQRRSRRRHRGPTSGNAGPHSLGPSGDASRVGEHSNGRAMGHNAFRRRRTK